VCVCVCVLCGADEEKEGARARAREQAKERQRNRQRQKRDKETDRDSDRGERETDRETAERERGRDLVDVILDIHELDHIVLVLPSLVLECLLSPCMHHSEHLFYKTKLKKIKFSLSVCCRLACTIPSTCGVCDSE
jgi:hypothetical protein